MEPSTDREQTQHVGEAAEQIPARSNDDPEPSLQTASEAVFDEGFQPL